MPILIFSAQDKLQTLMNYNLYASSKFRRGILSIIHQRKNHKLDEWSKDFINWAKSLPYAKELLFLEG